MTKIISIIQTFKNWFCGFLKVNGVVHYLLFPFNQCLNIIETAATISKNYYLSKLPWKWDMTLQKLLPKKKFPWLLEVLWNCTLMFWSNFFMWSTFLYLKLTKSKQYSNMTDGHLQQSLKLPLTQFHATSNRWYMKYKPTHLTKKSKFNVCCFYTEFIRCVMFIKICY